MKTELQERADVLAANLQRSIDACFEVLRSIGQLYGSAEWVGRQDFGRFVQPVLLRHSGIQALEWLPRLQECDRPLFEKTLQAEGYTNFQVTERKADGQLTRAAMRPEYFPVAYVEPLTGNELALGFDLFSDAIRRTALERARDTGAIAISGRVELVQETQRQFGFLVILPIYRGASGETIAERRDRLQGFVLGVFRVADVVRASLSGLNLDNINFFLCDQSDQPDKAFLATYEAQSRRVLASPAEERGFQEHHSFWQEKLSAQDNSICSRSFTIADRHWSLLLLPTSAYVDREELYEQSRSLADAATAEAEKLKQVLLNLQQTQARWFLEKRLIAIGVGLVFLVLGSVNLVAHRSITRLTASTNGMERTYSTMASLAKILAIATNAKTQLENVEIPNSETAPAIEQIDAESMGTIAFEVASLRQAIAPDAAQQNRLDLLEPLLSQRLTSLQQTVPQPQNNGGDRQLQQQIQQVIREMEQVERSRLQQWETQAAESVRSIFLINIGGILLSAALLVWVYYLLHRQINERQQVEVALFEANSQLEMEVQERSAELAQTKEISDLKQRLFSMVSHEFRTPLSTILLSTQLLSGSSEDWAEEKKRKNLSRIQSAAKTLAQLLNDILTLNRAEAGKLEFRPELLNLEPFCQQIVEEMQLSTGRSQIEFTQYGYPTPVKLDSKLLHSILTNLLSNAAKYSPPDSTVLLSLIYNPGSVVFQVKDYGIGIPPEDQQRIYETFYRSKNVGDIAGTGLGLAVVKTCVDLHGGLVAVTSAIATGTTFTVTLPQ
ncbi:CHASE domain-containing protein [Oculatella sp. FACHB-28]|uniref:CHASE domain-containing protein n=1 Tax=Oculatella sp. FACHB-28 TaxID=2692845 RepID=UPI001685E59A|nr:CHASE domain-containing protein [Oculatella sp. FACHB-28]